jgi:peptidoglycan/xylan/chitin deacetylase (PgdA/CDA1 family)
MTGTDGSYRPPYSAVERQARGAVVFTWDDGWDSHDEVAELHRVRRQKATFYITSGLLDTAQHLPAAALPGIAAMGHEIGCHSADHINMTTLTPATRAAQWASAAAIEAAVGGTYRVRSYAYPLGNNDVACNQEAYGRFDRVATIGLSQGYYTAGSGFGPWLYEQGTEVFRHGRFPWNQTTHPQLMALLRDHVRRRPVTLPVYAHQIGNADTPTLEQVTEALDYCWANGIPCLTTEEALPGPKVVNPGFESGLDGWTVITAGAAAAGTTIDTIADAPAAGLPGTQSLRIVSPNTTTAADSVHVFQTVPAKPLTAYSVSARVRHDAAPVGTGKFSVRLNEFNAMGGSIASRSIRGSASTAAWAQSSAVPATDAVWAVATGKTHPDCAYMTVGVYLQELTGTFYADHVHFGLAADGLLG